MLEAGRKAIALLDPTSPLGQAVLNAVKTIGKQVGAAPPETHVNNLQSQLVDAKRNAMQRLAMMQMQQQGGAPGGGQPGAAPPGAGAPPPQAMAA